jgi:hypothetical protein
MDIFEELAMWHLTRNGGVNVFVCPQFSIANGHSCPDFVALDFTNRIVRVVEVSAASEPNGLLKKVLDRDKQWLSELKGQLLKEKIIDDSWERFKVVLYIRERACEKFRKKLGETGDVILYSLEGIGSPWSWDWPSEKAQKEVEESGRQD